MAGESGRPRWSSAAGDGARPKAASEPLPMTTSPDEALRPRALTLTPYASSMLMPPPTRRATMTMSIAMATETPSEQERGDDAGRTLTLDGVQEGAYMLCKHSDDLLGHHARQVFRAKAAAMRGDNAIYYYLKQLFRKFGARNSAKKALDATHLVLEPAEFRQLIASDPAFQCAVPEDQVDALFHRLERDEHARKQVRHLDFVEFCLLDQNQLRLLLFKFRVRLKRLELTDNELSDAFKRLSNIGSAQMAPELLRAALARELDVVLTNGELAYLMLLLDCDHDGVVKLDDFEVFVKNDQVSFELTHPAHEQGIADLRVSVSEADEAALKRDGYFQLFPSLQDSTGVFLWYKREDGQAAIANILYAPTARDTDLVSKGFTCLQQDINRSGAFGKHRYIWLSFVPPHVQACSEIIDLGLSSGPIDDSNDASLWVPMHRGFQLVEGNLNEKSTKRGVFLWVRRRMLMASEVLIEEGDEAVLAESPHARATQQLRVDSIENHVRSTLRRKCPNDADGALNFALLFEELNLKNAHGISKQAMLMGLEAFGLKIQAKEFAMLWERMNPFKTKAIDLSALTQFLEMTETDIDEVVDTFQRYMTARSKNRLPNYRQVFREYNALGDGKLSRSDFQRLFATNHLNFTNSELSRVMQRFDADCDGIVDYADFLQYVTGFCDTASRRAERVAAAAEEIKMWAIECQNKKLGKDGNIDSSAAWKLLRPKQGFVEVETIDHVLRQRNLRLGAMCLRALTVLMAPASNGRIDRDTFHAFVNHLPRKISSLLYDMKKIAGSAPQDGAESADRVFDLLNIEGNGRLLLPVLARQINTLAPDKGVGQTDIKDFAYVAQWTGADCGGDGSILIDRFLSAIRDNAERRNMKNEFVTNFDSPSFIEGVRLLRQEIRRCAKSPDGKFNFTTPFRIFDKNNNGQIILSEFENAIRELGVDRYLSDQEVRSLMRRFDLNASGGIDYEEFLRFAAVDAIEHPGMQLPLASREAVVGILEQIAVKERLTPRSARVYCNAMKRTFGILDQETRGVVSVDRFVHTISETGIALTSDQQKLLLETYQGESDSQVCYEEFCDDLQDVVGLDAQDPVFEAPPMETIELLRGLFHEYQSMKMRGNAKGKPPVDFMKAFNVSDSENACIHVSAEDLKDVLWVSGIRHPYLRDELDVLLRCFQTPRGAAFDVQKFCEFLENGPIVLFKNSGGVLDQFIARLHSSLGSFLATGQDAQDRLFDCFRELDVDANGVVSDDEFRLALEKAGLRRFLEPNDELILLQFLDSNGDGVISFHEFVEFVQHAEDKLNAVATDDSASAPSDPVAGTRSPSPMQSPAVSPANSPSKSIRSCSKSPTPSSPKSPPRMSSDIRRDTECTGVSKELMLQVWKLNRKLHPSFPFDKYFAKYALDGREQLIKTRVFEKVIDKFFARLIEHSIAYNMHELDVDLITRGCVTKADATMAYFGGFLDGLSRAEGIARQERAHSGSSSDDDVSCSSDDGEHAAGSAVGVLVRDAILRFHRSTAEQDALRAHVKDQLSAIEKSKARTVLLSEKKLYQTLTAMSLRFSSKEAAKLLTYLAVDGGHKPQYDGKRVLTLVQEQVAMLLGEDVPSATATATPTPAPAPTRCDNPRCLRPELADRMYGSFMTAARMNISGRKLLEKFDGNRTGVIALHEFEAAMRLLGCSLSTAEMDEIKSVYSSGSSGGISYVPLVQFITRQQRPSKSRAPAPRASATTTFNRVAAARPPPIEVPTAAWSPPARAMEMPAEPKMLSPVPEVQVCAISIDELRRTDAKLSAYFADLLLARRLDGATVLQAFKAYDGLGTGFVAIDAVHAVLRKLDLRPPDDLMRTLLWRFTAMSSDKFDYVEFCSVAAPSSTSPRRLPVLSDPVKPSNGTLAVQPPPIDLGRSISEQERRPPSLPELLDRAPSSMADAYDPPACATSSAGWSCDVCFHTQTRPTALCEICGAHDPSSVQHETLLQCSSCYFRSRVGATHCELCRLPLDGALPSPPSSPERERERERGWRSASPSKQRQQQTPSPQMATEMAVPYDEGWLT